MALVTYFEKKVNFDDPSNEKISVYFQYERTPGDQESRSQKLKDPEKDWLKTIPVKTFLCWIKEYVIIRTQLELKISKNDQLYMYLDSKRCKRRVTKKRIFQK